MNNFEEAYYNRIDPPTIADIIENDFDLPVETVCADLKISEDDLEHMTPELSGRLGTYFLVNENYFYDIFLNLKKRNSK